MRAAAAACRCGEVIRATGESGGWRSLAERRMVASGVSLCEAAVAVVGALSDGRSELLTVVVGEAAVPEDRDTLARVLRDAFAGLALQVLDGGQPGPPFQVGVE
jgi:dihydroxyacetone kinase-like predicted kinase